MIKSKLYFGITLLGVVVLLAGCSGSKTQEPPTPAPLPPVEHPPLTSHGGPVEDYVSLFDSLRAEGATVEPVEEVFQPFFSVKGFTIKVNGHDVQVFEYDEVAQADSEAQLVSPDGNSIGTTMASWIAPPHFYKAGRIIVLYVGEEDTVIDTLDSVLGLQFAGS